MVDEPHQFKKDPAPCNRDIGNATKGRRILANPNANPIPDPCIELWSFPSGMVLEQKGHMSVSYQP